MYTNSSSTRTLPAQNILRLFFLLLATATLLLSNVSIAKEAATDERPDQLIKRITTDVMTRIKADTDLQNGDTAKVVALVNETILPSLAFEAMTRKAVGKNWSLATPEEKNTLQKEFKTLLIYTYSGALSRAKDHEIKVRRLRAAKEDTAVEVKTLITGGNSPLEVNYRLEKSATGWKVHDVSVANAWLIEAYRADFAKVVEADGIKGLIKKLQERNTKNASK